MKMKAVCEQTGLTDRAVRLYIEEKLIEPAVTESYLGRKSLDFSEEDVGQLRDIAVLRRFGFSIAQIRAVKSSPEEARFVLENARREARAAISMKEQSLQAMDKVSIRGTCTLAELAEALRCAETADRSAEDDSQGMAEPGMLRILMEVLTLCAFICVGILGAVLVTDMAVFYFSSGALQLSPDGLMRVYARSWPYLVWIIAAAALSVPLGYCLGVIWRYGRNHGKPEVCIQAVVIDKKRNADAVVLSSFVTRSSGMIELLIFRTEDGKVLELTVPQRCYYQTAIGTGGELVYQGGKMLSFTPEASREKLERRS